MAEKSFRQLDCRVIQNEMITPTVFKITFEPTPPVDFKAGQFISIVIPGAGPKGRNLRRAYSIASPPERPHWELCIKLVDDGPGTSYLHSLKPEDVFKGEAPFGDFVFKTPPERHVVFLATGTGIAPFYSMVLSKSYQQAKPKSATCLHGVREETELLYHVELGSIPDLKFVSAVTRPKNPHFNFKGRITDYLRNHEAEIDWARTDFYLCGSGAMIDEMKELLTDHGVPKEQTQFEVYYKASP